MVRKKNDATLSKLGDLYQHYIALLDCFTMKQGDKIQIEVKGDVTFISSDGNNNFQKEVKHHIGYVNLSDRDIDFWNTFNNWIIDYDDNIKYDQLILFTTADISKNSIFKNWNSKNKEDKYDVLHNAGILIKKREGKFRTYYNEIFSSKILSKEALCELLNKITIVHRQLKIQGISAAFSSYLVTIPPENRDYYITALLGVLYQQVIKQPHKWEVSFEGFQSHAQKIAPSYMEAGKIPLPLDYLEYEPSINECETAKQKIFAKALEDIEYAKMIPKAITDYWKTTKTITCYFSDNISYLSSLRPYRRNLEERMFYAKESVRNDILILSSSRQHKLFASRKLCSDILGWKAEDFGTIVDNQSFFQNGIVHDIVDEQKFNWDVEDES